VRYLDSIRFVFVKQNWFVNTVMCLVCMLIPAIGGIVLTGYMFEVLDAIRRDPKRSDYPDFKFDRFVPYLMRGVWPFIVQIIAGFVIVIPIMVLVGLLMVAMLTRSEIVIAVAWLLYFLALVTLSAVTAMVIWPATFYAGVSQQLNFPGLMEFVKAFLKKVGKEQLLSVLFIAGAGVVLVPVGLLACFVGALFVTIVLTFAHFHLEYQLYELYLQRGGRPIPVKDESADAQRSIPVETQPPAGGQS
jgi:Protein of unknown function (DUF4013)